MGRIMEKARARQAAPAFLALVIRMPYEDTDPETGKTLRWIWTQLERHYGSQETNEMVFLVRRFLDAGDIEQSLRYLAACCCEGEVVDRGGAWPDCANRPIPALQSILDQLARLEAVWRKAREVAA